ncbi:MAG: hypothetical protein QOF78_2213 [Phycisphaerales bacterium]|nr:hypothetical protein [Phycisphaerales bacterium]
MSNQTNPFSSGSGEQKEPGHFSARVPEKVARGIYTTGQIIQDSPKEFVIDFMLGHMRPYQIGARVVITPQTMAEFISALQQNVDAYERQFGPVPPAPPPPENRPTIQEIYDNYKLADDMHSGVYANTVLLGHSQTEFFFDFITGFYPHPAVAARVIIASLQGPRFLNTLKGALQQYHTRYTQQKPPEPPLHHP